MFNTSDLTKSIREYELRHAELRQSHHFVFDCPFGDPKRAPEYVWIGANPAVDANDWTRTQGCRDEETRERDFQKLFGRTVGSQKRLNQIQRFIGGLTFQKTTNSQNFFWCSKDLTASFRSKFGYSYMENPHKNFCVKINLELINRANPKAVLVERHMGIEYMAQEVDCRLLKEYQSSRGYTFLQEHLLDNRHRCISFTHLSARGKFLKELPELSALVRQLLA